jgi:hypothetical protein
MNIQVGKLKQGSKILLETKECVFDIEVVDPANGGIIISGGRRFITPTNAKLLGVFGRENNEKNDYLIHPNEIEKNVGIEIIYQDKDRISSDFVTSPIISAKIFGDGWSYEVWEDKEKEKVLAQSLENARAKLRITKIVEEDKDTETDEDTLS